MKKEVERKSIFIILVICLLVAVFGLVLDSTTDTQTASAETAISDTSDLSFTLYNDNTEYKVSALNRNLTEATIPSYYEGLPVTQIADNAFISCTSLENVFIPETVVKVGNNALCNCINLHTLKGMVNVTEIGNNAFAMCSELKNLIIPPSITVLGTSIIRNIPDSSTIYVRTTESVMRSLNANWDANSNAEVIYGNDLVCSPIEEDGVIVGYSIDCPQGLSSESDYILKCSYLNEDDGIYYPITNIAYGAFMCSSFNSLTLEYDEEHITSHYTVNIESYAFMLVDAEYIDIEVDVTFYDELNTSGDEYEFGTSTGIFTGSTIKSITLPSTIESITNSMFSYCTELVTIKNSDVYLGANTLPDTIMYIGEQAFEECTSLVMINIPNSIEKIGNAAFDKWGFGDTFQTINIDLYKAGDKWDANWEGTLYDNVVVNFKTITVILDDCGGTGGSGTIEAMYGRDMPSALKPYKSNYDFLGYYSSDGETQYYDENMNSVHEWDKLSSVSIYAEWKGVTYTVTFDKENGTGGTDLLKVTYGDLMPEATAPVLEGYTFKGYYTEQYGNGIKYYSADMDSLRIYDIGGDATLYAYWEAVIYNITYYITNSSVNGLRPDNDENPDTYTIEDVTDGDYVFIETKLNGYKLTWEPIAISQNYTGDVFVTGTWEEIVTSITYSLSGGTNSNNNPTSIRYSDSVTLQEPTRVGYVFDGWYLNGTQVTTLSKISEDSITLTAKWKTRIDASIYTLDPTVSTLTLSGYTNIILKLPTKNFNSPCHLIIASNMENVHIFATSYLKYDLYITINSRTTDFNLYLENFALCGPVSVSSSGSASAKVAITMTTTNDSALNLYTYNKVLINGGSSGSLSGYSYNGRYAISCAVLNIYAADNLYIYGGDPGASGGSGAVAIYATSGVNYYCDTSKVHIYDKD